jgi:hypothetical protein
MAYGLGTNVTGNKNLIANEITPPIKKNVVLPVAGVIGGFLICAIYLPLALVVLAISMIALMVAINYNNNVFPELKTKWENTFICNKCGTTFEHVI